MGSYHITVLKGDGIGPDVVTEAMGVLECVGKKYGHDFVFNEKLAGGCAYDAYGEPLPEETLEACKNSDAILLGAVGGPKWDHLPANLRPEAGALLKLRSSLGLYANLRPAIIHKALSDASPIKPEIIGDSLDILVVRELTGGIYFGERGYREGKHGEEAYDVEAYSEFEIKADDARGHRVRITFKDGRKPVEGYCSGFSRALDCDPEIAEIDVLEHKEANWGESFDETEVEDIIILD